MPESGSSFLTRKDLGGIPNYVWILGGAAALMLWRSRSASSSGGTSSAQQQQMMQEMQQLQQQEYLQSQMASLSAYPGSGQTGSSIVLLPSSTPSGTPAASTPSTDATPSLTTLTGETSKGGGSGYGNPTGVPISQGITTASGTYYGIANPTEEAALQQSGESIYWQPSPGVFAPYTSGERIGASPLYYEPSTS